jgi:hypothetical protein
VSRGRRDVVYYHKWMTSHNFEKLTTYKKNMYYSIKTSNTQGWKLSEAQLPKAPKYLAELLATKKYGDGNRCSVSVQR